MRLLRTWDTVQTTLKEFTLPPSLERVARWVQRHPRAVLAGGLVLVMAALLAQTPADKPTEFEAYDGHTPLFV